MLGQKCSEEIRIINIIHTKDSVQNEEQTQDGIPENQESHFYWWGKRDVKKKKRGNINRNYLSTTETKCKGLNLMTANQNKGTFSPVIICFSISM